MLLTKNPTTDHDQLCRLDVLGIEDQPSKDQKFVYKEYKDQLQTHPERFYETSLIWKASHQTLDKNNNGSLIRLKSSLGKLKKYPEKFEQYDDIIKDQLAEGTIERVRSQPHGKEYYIPHKFIIEKTQKVRKCELGMMLQLNQTVPAFH